MADDLYITSHTKVYFKLHCGIDYGEQWQDWGYRISTVGIIIPSPHTVTTKKRSVWSVFTTSEVVRYGDQSRVATEAAGEEAQSTEALCLQLSHCMVTALACRRPNGSTETQSMCRKQRQSSMSIQQQPIMTSSSPTPQPPAFRQQPIRME